MRGIADGAQQLDSALDGLAQAAQQADQALDQIDSGAGGAFASGGMVRGPGTTTSDSILARLSKGEFVIRAAAVEHFGPSFFATLNSLRMPKFNVGGLVSGFNQSLSHLAIPRFADGSVEPVATGGRNINLTIDNGVTKNTFRMWADEEVAKKVIRYSVSRQAASAGRKSGAFG